MGLPRERSIGRYELLIELARGGMAELFLGRLRGAGGFEKRVAIKRILPHLAQDRQFVEMFLNEGRIAAHLAHPNVCQVFELDEVDGELFLAMEYLDGVSWQHLLEELPRGVLAMRLAAGVLAQAADGLHYAHTLCDAHGRPTPVVHRDVSPQNLFVTVDGVCKVLDFGVSKMMKDGTRTRSGVIKGKLPYMAPEQIRGEELDGRADVFSLGVCAWEALAGKRLFDRESDFKIWKAITEEDVPAIAAFWPDCPPALDAAVRRALDRDPARRHATARELADDLRGHAGMASLGEIADAVRTRCADRIAARARQVATALGSDDPAAASATLVEEAGETVDFRAQRSRAAGMQLRDASIAVVRPSDPRVPRSEPSASATALSAVGSAPPRRSHVATAVIAALVAAVVTAVVVVVVLGRRSETPVPAPAPAPDAAVAKTGREDWVDDVVKQSQEALKDGRKALKQGKEATEQVRDSLDGLGDAFPSAEPDPPAKQPAPQPRAAKPKPKPAPPPVQPPAPAPEPTAAPASADPGFLNVGSEPYAIIYLDGKRFDQTPMRRAIPAGKHQIRAVREDGREQTRTIEIVSGQDAVWKLTW